MGSFIQTESEVGRKMQPDVRTENTFARMSLTLKLYLK